MEILSIIFPIVFIVAAGYLYGRLYQPRMEFANELQLRIFVPALVFDVLSSGDFQVVTYKWLALGGLIVVLGSGLIAWPLGRLFKFPMRAYLPCMMFNNCGNLGLPLAILAFGEFALEAAVVLFLVSNLLHFTLGVVLFGGGLSLKRLVINPVNISTALALLINFTQTPIPEPILFPIHMLGEVVIPLMLFSLGVRMIYSDLSHLRIGIIGGIICPLCSLVFAIGAGYVLPLDEFQTSALILFSVLPPAVLNFLFAERYGQSPQMVASLVMISHGVTLIVLPIVLWWLLQ